MYNTAHIEQKLTLTVHSWALAAIYILYSDKCVFFHFLTSKFDLGQVG